MTTPKFTGRNVPISEIAQARAKHRSLSVSACRKVCSASDMPLSTMAVPSITTTAPIRKYTRR